MMARMAIAKSSVALRVIVVVELIRYTCWINDSCAGSRGRGEAPAGNRGSALSVCISAARGDAGFAPDGAVARFGSAAQGLLARANGSARRHLAQAMAGQYPRP